MRTLMIASLALLAAAGTALAADAEPVISPGPFAPPPAFPAHAGQDIAVTPGPFEAPPAFPRTRPYNWTGFYVGINGGFALATADWNASLDATSGAARISGGFVGGTIGYNLQTGDPFVVGIEGDFEFSILNGSLSTPSCAVSCAVKAPALGSARLRFGYAFDGILPYATAGFAYSRAVIDGPFGTDATDRFGWTAGGGVEFVLSDALRAKIEYLYFGGLEGFSCGGGCVGPVSFDVNANIIRAGLNYRLGH